MLIDSHAHLDFLPEGRTIDEILADSKKAGVDKIVCVGTSIEASKKSIEVAEKYSRDDLQIYATCGIHPQDGKDEVGEMDLLQCIKTLKQLARSSKKVIAVGECGLDYYLEGEKRVPTVDKDKQFQRELFKKQIDLAVGLNLPLIIHCRNAWDEIFEMISNSKNWRGQSSTLKGVFHSWTGGVEAAKKVLELGFYISFSGIVTFKNAPLVQETAKMVTLERMLIETDSPFLAPEPHRGSKNEPKNVKIIADFIAGLRNVSPIDIYSATAANAKRLFKFE
ncbi:TatD family hydrolase [Candidatus Curtissbacteria bacterium]|nr:TatD family hydrolase [Candidatus Curtissbacteria bacterium]